MTKKIKLTQGKIALVDDEDYERINQYKWRARQHNNTNSFYAERNIVIQMASEVLNISSPNIADHINHNTLDNRKGELRIVTPQQNTYNRRPHKNSSSKYKGVAWYKKGKKWQSQIMWPKGKPIFLGYYKNEIEAAKRYDKEAKKLFGTYAYLNFPEKEVI